MGCTAMALPQHCFCSGSGSAVSGVPQEVPR